MRIIVDADACPVKDIIIKEAAKRKLPVILVSSLDHFTRAEYPEHVQTLYVEKGQDASDFKIVQISQSQDIVVTQDYGLASLVLNKVAYVIHHTGFVYTEENIDSLLQTRYISAQARQRGNRTKGPGPINQNDKQAFKDLLHYILRHSVS